MDPVTRPDSYRPAWPADPVRGAVVAPPIRRIMLATDLGPASAAATEHAIGLARTLGATLVVTSVVEAARPMPGGGARADQLRERRESGVRTITDSARGLGIRATFLVWLGEAGPSIIAAAEAEEADLIIMGTHGRTGVTRLLLGSVSDHVIRHASCPVFIVPPAQDPTGA